MYGCVRCCVYREQLRCKGKRGSFFVEGKAGMTWLGSLNHLHVTKDKLLI